HVTELRREGVGPFTLEGAISLEKLEELVHNARLSEALLPIHHALDDIPALEIGPSQSRSLQQGKTILLESSFPQDISSPVCFMCDHALVAIGEVSARTARPLRVFHSWKG